MKDITAKQEECLSFISSFIKNNGYPPTVREMGDHFNFTSRAAYDHLLALEKKKRISRTAGISRGIRIINEE